MTGWFGLALWVAVPLLAVPSASVRAQVADDRLPVLAAVEEARRLARAGSCGRAIARWEVLAEGGSAQSARWLGALFKEGCGDRAPDLARAHAWLSLSSGAEARRLLGEFGPYLSAADRRQAERLRASLVAPAP